MKNREAARLADAMLEKFGPEAVSECDARAQYRLALADHAGAAAWRRAAMKARHPQPFGTKAQQNKGKRVQPAFQKRNNQKGR